MKNITSHKLGANRKETAHKKKKCDSNFSQSKDIREDRGARQGKFAQKPQSTLTHLGQIDRARERGLLLSERAMTSKQPVKLKLHYPHAKTVTVAGTFNGWHPESIPLRRAQQDEWTAELFLESGKYEYRFVIDGQWTNDLHAAHQVPNGFGEENSVLIVT